MPFPDAGILLSVERPGRYVGGEFGAVRPSARADPVGRACLVFPDVYEVGMSHLGLRILANEINAEPDLLAERAFSPWPDMAAALRGASLPLSSLESGRPLRDFDVVGITLPHELCAATVLGTLESAGIPVRSADRGESDPIVAGGGGWATHPAAVEPFLDAVFVGDGEGAAGAIVRAVGEARRRGERREAILERLGDRPEILVPALRGTSHPGARARRRISADAPGTAPFASGPVPAIAAVFDRVTVELARGCGAGCRFCQAGYACRPERHRSVESAVEEIAASIRHTGYDEVSLSALSTADYPDLVTLLERLSPLCDRREIALGVSSLRAYGVPDAALSVLSRTRLTGLTLAPEAGTQRLRDVISKRVAEDDLVAAVRRIAAAGWKRVKLYFMIGLPTETDDDVAAIADLASRVASAGRAAGKGRFAATVSVSNFVPKPHTPFQWEPMLPIDEIRRRQALLRGRLRRGVLDLKVHDARAGVLEALLARGGAQAAHAILEARGRGAYLDAWTEHFEWARWSEALAAAGLHPDDAARPLDPAAPTPWSHVDAGVSVRFLGRERERALAGEPTERCDPSPARFRCDACGVGCTRAPAPDPAPAEPVPQRQAVPAGSGDGPGVAEDAVWYRIAVRKEGKAAFLGHLDFVRALARTLRRAGFPVAYSAGFHPAPRIAMAASLALGVVGVAEPGDVQATRALEDPPAVLARLRESAPDGIGFLSLSPAGKANPRVARDLAHADYVVAVPGAAEEAVRRAVSDAEAADAWMLRDARRERWNGRDAKPAVALLEAVRLADAIPGLEPDPDGWGLRIRTAIEGAPPIRPLGALLLGAPENRLSAFRTALLDRSGRKLP